jgi:TonB-dependent starch-binding outer membrane protein SusC
MLSHVYRKVGLGIAAVGVILSASVPPVFAQQAAGVGTVEGTVRENGTNRPVEGAQVTIVGTTLGTYTNNLGVYRIQNVPARPAEVRARFVGFAPAVRPVTVEAGQTVTVNFDLAQSALQLDQVVTTGTGGAVAVKRLGNTVATIQPPQFAPINSASELLQGREPGVVGLPSGGLSGEGARIRIRGNASLSQSNEPIIFVDGLRINASGDWSANVGAGGGGSPSRLDDIDPTTIERIEILKGAAAATLYGTEASNGVIQIFTKKGTAGAPRWTFNAQQDAIVYPSDRIKPNAGFARTQAQADRANEFWGRSDITPFAVFEEKEVEKIMGTGLATTVDGSVTGGSSAITYFVSGRYFNENGPVDNPGYPGKATDEVKRAQGTANLTAFPLTNLKVGARASYTNSRMSTVQNNNNIYGMTALSMFGKPEVANCDNSSVASPSYCTGAGNEFGNNAFMTVRESFGIETKQTVDRFIGVFDANYTPITPLAFTGMVGVDYSTSQNTNFQPFGYAVDHFTSNDTLGNKYTQDRNERQITLDGKMNWNIDFTPAISSSFVAGAQGFLTKVAQPGGTSKDFPGPGLEVASAGGQPQVFDTISTTVNGGIFAQEQLGWRNWVFGTVGARYDYSSAFGENAGGVLYPKASISIIPSDLPGWSGYYGVSTLRLRAAYGQSGRQPSAFDKLTTYAPLNGEAGSGLVPSNLGNPDLKPEISTEWEAGTEIGLFQDRLGLDFTYWNRTVNDLLVQKQFPISGGFRSTQLANVGQMKANGFEIAVKGFVLNRPTMSLDLFANAAYLDQKVTSLGGSPPLKVGGSYPRYRNFIKEGEYPGALFGAKVVQPCRGGETYTCVAAGQVPFDTDANGVPDTEAQFLAYLASAGFLTQTVSGVVVTRADRLSVLNPLRVDEDGDGDFLDHYLGKPVPDWSGAFGGTFTFAKRWRLYSLFEYKAGNFTVTNLTDAFRQAHPVIGRNIAGTAAIEAVIQNNATTPQEKEAAALEWARRYKALSPYDGLNQNENGDFVRWRELSLTYSASPDFAARIGARDLAITFTGRNLVLWTKYSGTDPEINYIGRGGAGSDQLGNNFGDSIDAFGFPVPRRFALSVRLGY